jgi:hypothetical protein
MTYRRLLFIVLGIALLAGLYATYKRTRIEAQSRRVEIVMDYADFITLARSYDYNPSIFLNELRKVGLTSVAVQEELGSQLNVGSNAVAYSGQQLTNQARLAPLGDPRLAAIVKRGVAADSMYLIVYNAATYARYMRQLPMRFERKSLQVLRGDRAPYLIAIKTTPDFFGTVGLGIPDEEAALVKRAGLLLVPRLQDDERFGPAQIDAIMNDAVHKRRSSTVIFFGLRNEVLGYPNAIPATAAAIKRLHLNFGTIETYDPSQTQKGNDDLARLVIEDTARVQAISRPELDKLGPDGPSQVVARYLLGVRERNVRVVYLRPWSRPWGTRSIFQSNIELVRELGNGITQNKDRLGRATPIPGFRFNRIVLALTSLAVPALVLLILESFGIVDRRLAIGFFVATLLFYAAGSIVHHAAFALKMIALAGAIAFPTAAMLAIAPLFTTSGIARFGPAAIAGARTLGIALFVTLGGAIVVIALVSTPFTMEEIDRFTGVKAVLFTPPVIVLALYFFTSKFGAKIDDPRTAFGSPVRVVQIVAFAILAGGAFVLLARSGNQSDIAPSNLELSLRAHLTTLLSVRPRFKEFGFGFPLLALLPALALVDKRRFGWFVALGGAVGLADVVDTFSHLHTSLTISLARLAIGAILGGIIGFVVVLVYRAIRRTVAA